MIINDTSANVTTQEYLSAIIGHIVENTVFENGMSEIDDIIALERVIEIVQEYYTR